MRRGSSEELRLPKQSLAIEFALTSGVPRTGEVYVDDASSSDPDQIVGQLAILFSGERGFIPVRMNKQISLIGVASVSWIRPVLQSSSALDGGAHELLTLFDQKHNVEVQLAIGDAFHGVILDSSPSDRRRVGDILNSTIPFLRLWTERGQYLLNKRLVTMVRELNGGGS